MKKIKVYRQHRLEQYGIDKLVTCGICCLMMVLDYFGIEYPTVKKEATYYEKYGAEATEGTLGAAIAFALCIRGLKVKLVHSSEQMLENQNGYFSDEIHQALLKEHLGYIESAKGRFDLETGVPITVDTLRDELARQRLVIAQIFIEGDDGAHEKVMHWILLYGYENGCFLVCDPLEGKTMLSDEELEEGLETPFGRSYISVEGKNKEKETDE